MAHPSRRRRLPWSGRAFRLAGPAGLAVLLSSCSFIEIDSPLNSLKPKGPFAEQIDSLFWPVFWIAVVIFVIVQGLIIVAAIVFRDREGRKEPKQLHGNTKLEVAWTIIPALILAGIAVPTVQTIFDLTECDPGAMEVDVIGHQWWFEYRYPEHSDIQTANVMVVPAGREVCAVMTSDDVIHNFWVPELNGKRYLIPNHETVLRLQADEPGMYWGQCGEFCGLSHSLMRARVEALTEADFEAWVANQQQAATPPAEGTPAARGAQVFVDKACTQCHTVDYGSDSALTNIVAEENFNGPNLTHFATREVFAGASLPHEGLSYEDALALWLSDPPAVKPGSYMPDLGLTGEEIDNVIAWLQSLR